ncbi:hypothetical protein PMZ80_006062 [Knufia obscura]|uniref:Uncharacterized protein n=2 Tax=Knufia TaxID=430999 RepID=A0AAN8EN45_9EURO|nr:hypothetical protein PMZ80_006062 [Knufia obscura]KAK5954732.1 hypothetical protein OHC33_004456 [Knufia fluminis]
MPIRRLTHYHPLLSRRYLSDQAVRRNSNRIFGSLLSRTASEYTKQPQTPKQQAPQAKQLLDQNQGLADCLKSLLNTGKIVFKLEVSHAAKASSRRKATGVEKGVPTEVPGETAERARSPHASKERPEK